MRLTVTAAMLAFGLLGAASAQNNPVQRASEKGLASWYGTPYDGQPSASGEIYHQEELTAAHRTLPFGTLVRVRRLDNQKSVVVRINDRGPFIQSRVIDLSRAAARLLGMKSAGLAPVALEVLDAPAAGE